MPLEETQANLDGQEEVKDESSEQTAESVTQDDSGKEEETQQVTQDAARPALKPKKTDTVDYWKSEYKAEKAKRQRIAREMEQFRSGVRPSEQRSQTASKLSSLNDVKSVEDFAEFIFGEVDKRVGQRLTETQKSSRLESSEDSARRTHNGDDGLPAYDDLIDEVVEPLVERNPAILKLIAEMDNPAEAAYTLGVVLKYPNISELLKGQGRDETIKKIDQVAKQAVTLKGAKKESRSTKPTADEIMNWTADKTEAEISKVTGRSF